MCLTESIAMTYSLPSWATELLESLELPAVELDLDTLQHLIATLGDDAEHAPLLVGFIAGYAAGRAEGEGMASFERSHAASVRFMAKSLSGE